MKTKHNASAYKFTPGPWESSDNVIYKVARESAQRTRIASEVNSRENAALISAAPELLNCLHMMACELAHFEKHGTRSNLYESICEQYAAVIKKARGE